MPELANEPIRIPPAQSPTGAAGDSASAPAPNITTYPLPAAIPSSGSSVAVNIPPLGVLSSTISLAPTTQTSATTFSVPTAAHPLAAIVRQTTTTVEEATVAASSPISPLLVAGLVTTTTAEPTLSTDSLVADPPSPTAPVAAPATSPPSNHTAVVLGTAPDPTQNGGLPASPDMSNAQQPAGLRQSVGYGGQATYPPSSAYPYQQPLPPSMPSQPQGDPYRTAPTMGPNSHNMLPSVHTLESIHQRPHQPTPSSHMQVMPPPVPSNVNAPMPFYAQGGMAFRDIGMGGFLPPGLIGVGRPKKEIKRRTKTGCLTCRKRRIKCDEGQPTCNNCRKSKRDCAGYDPIFKQQQHQQQQQPPTAIQPATNQVASLKAPPPPAPSTLPSSSSVSYSGQPPALTNSGPAASPTALPTSLKTEYSGTSPATAPIPIPIGLVHAHSPPQSQHQAQPQFQSSYPGLGQVKGGITTSHPFPCMRVGTDSSREAKMEPSHQSQPQSQQQQQQHQQAVQAQHPQQAPQQHTPGQGSTHTTAKVSLYSMVERIKSSSICPRPEEPSRVAEVTAEFDKFFVELYCSGLCSFFETRWYEVSKPNLPRNPPLLHLWTAFVEAVQPGYPQQDHAPYLEGQMMWALATQVFITTAAINQGPTLASDTDAVELMNRVKVFDALMSGEYMDANPLLPPIQGQGDHQRLRQFEFWHLLARLLTLRPSPTQQNEQMGIVDQLRKLLDGRENRDVLYSIAVLRVLGGSSRNSGVSDEEYKNENDPSHRWAVASQFIDNESQSAGGTTATVRRFSELARLAFVNPGWNCEPR